MSKRRKMRFRQTIQQVSRPGPEILIQDKDTSFRFEDEWIFFENTVLPKGLSGPYHMSLCATFYAGGYGMIQMLKSIINGFDPKDPDSLASTVSKLDDLETECKVFLGMCDKDAS